MTNSNLIKSHTVDKTHKGMSELQLHQLQAIDGGFPPAAILLWWGGLTLAQQAGVGALTGAAVWGVTRGFN